MMSGNSQFCTKFIFYIRPTLTHSDVLLTLKFGRPAQQTAISPFMMLYIHQYDTMSVAITASQATPPISPSA